MLINDEENTQKCSILSIALESNALLSCLQRVDGTLLLGVIIEGPDSRLLFLSWDTGRECKGANIVLTVFSALCQRWGISVNVKGL